MDLQFSPEEEAFRAEVRAFLQDKLPKPLAAGMYRVEYRAVGGDNHPMTGSFSFTVR